MNLQRENCPSLQHKIEMEGHRAAGKGARELRLQDGLALLMGDCQRRDGMMVFLRGLRLPSGDGGQSLIGADFHHGRWHWGRSMWTALRYRRRFPAGHT